MLYVLHGSDIGEGRDKLHALLIALQAKRPGAELFRLAGEEVTSTLLQEYSSARGLFESKHIVLLYMPFATAESKRITLEALHDLASSENLFVLFEETVDAKTLVALTRHATKVQTHSKAAKQKKELFNRFALTDALGKRDRKILWVLYQKALRAGVAEEEIHGLLFWQIKSMLMAATAKNVGESGLKPFVYSKAKAAAAQYSKTELLQLSEDLVTLYHEVRRGKYDMETALERFVLSV